MAIKKVCFAAFVVLAAAPAWAQGEGNGPGGNAGVFTGWVVPLGGASAPAMNTNAESYTPSPCFSETLSGPTPMGGVASESGFQAWPAQALGGAGAGTAHARAPARGARGG